MIQYQDQADWMSIKKERESQTVIFKDSKKLPSNPEKLSTKAVDNPVNKRGGNSHVV